MQTVNNNCKVCPEYNAQKCDGNADNCMCRKCPRNFGTCLCIRYCRETESVLN